MNNEQTALNLTQKESTTLLHAWIKDLERQSGISVTYHLDQDRTITEAITRQHTNKSMLVYLGINGLCPDKNPNTPVNTEKFVRVTVNLFHEARHVQQEYDERTTTSSQTQNLIIADIACRRNWKLYMQRYLSNIQEMDAEKSGIISAYNILSQTFPNVNCERLVTNYVNERITSPNVYFISNDRKTQYSTLQDILDEFDTTRAKYETKPHRTLPLPLGRYRQDAINCVLVVNQSTAQKWKQFIAKMYPQNIDDLPTAQHFDKMVASIMLHTYPEYKHKYKILQTIDLSAQTIFGMPFPESTPSIRLRLGQVFPIQSRHLTSSKSTPNLHLGPNVQRAIQAANELSSDEQDYDISYPE